MSWNYFFRLTSIFSLLLLVSLGAVLSAARLFCFGELIVIATVTSRRNAS